MTKPAHETLWNRLRVGVWRSTRHPAWPDLAPDDVMAAVVRDRFHAKQGRSSARWTVNGPAKKWVVYLKRHCRSTWWHGWLAALIPWRRWSAAWREVNHLHWAAANGVLVPCVAAVGERVGPWGRLQSYVAIEELTGMLPLHEAVPAAAGCLPPSAFVTWKRGLCGELARLVRRLHGLRHFHKDLYLCHFYVPATCIQTASPRWHGAVHMIDFHRLGHHPWSWPWWQVKDVAQLLYSSEVTGVTARDRLRFWRLYAGPEGRRGWGRLLRWGAVIRWRNYRQHNAGRKQPTTKQVA